MATPIPVSPPRPSSDLPRPEVSTTLQPRLHFFPIFPLRFILNQFNIRLAKKKRRGEEPEEEEETGEIREKSSLPRRAWHHRQVRAYLYLTPLPRSRTRIQDSHLIVSGLIRRGGGRGTRREREKKAPKAPSLVPFPLSNPNFHRARKFFARDSTREKA